MTIQEIITRTEDQTFDCKSIQIAPKALAIPIVAFANADGGVIAIGVSDERDIEGVDQHIKVTEKVTVNKRKVTVNDDKVTEKVTVNKGKVAENPSKVIEKFSKVIEKAEGMGDELSKNRIAILKLMIENPYITRSELAKAVGVSENSIWRNIEAMRGKYLRRVGPDKGGFWEVLY